MDLIQVPVAPGGLISWPIDLISASRRQFDLIQLSQTQDYSLRAWVSRYVNGIPAPPGYTPVMKIGGWPIVAYSSGAAPSSSFAVLLPAGFYTLNVLNLTNELNVVGFTTIILE